MACILLWSSAVRSMIHKHRARSMWQRSAPVVSWSWKKYSCHSKLVSTLSMLLLSVLSWRASRAWNPHQLYLSPDTWSLWQSKASVHLLWSLCWCHWCCLSSAWSSRHWSPCRRLWRLCHLIYAHLTLPVLPLLLSHRCHQQSGDWWFFCLQCWQCLHDLLRRLSSATLQSLTIITFMVVLENRNAWKFDRPAYHW